MVSINLNPQIPDVMDRELLSSDYIDWTSLFQALNLNKTEHTKRTQTNFSYLVAIREGGSEMDAIAEQL